jgi:WD40 repeat protein/DNA-binding SARP family transcriptional activator/energy-coupling factor transporter ATP-binding protein EcfA2
MTTISAQLFGTFSIQIGQEQHTRFRTAKVQALLAYLLLEHHSSVRRDDLYDLFWPDLPRKSAQVNLRQTLYQLRKFLNVIDETSVVSTNDSIQLNPMLSISADVYDFDNLLTTNSTHEHHDKFNCLPCRERLEQAIALYSGPLATNVYLSDSNAFEAWINNLRDVYKQRFINGLTSLATIHAKLGNYEEAESLARRQLEYDNLRETAYQQLMKALTYADKREAAISEYESFCIMLHSQLGMSPTRRTKNLAERILAGEADLDSMQTPNVRGYELDEKIGDGMFGAVYQARQIQIEREVVIKVINRDFANRPSFIRSFEVETQTIARLEHPFIVPLYDYWREPDSAFLVMRQMHGGNLETVMQERGIWELSDISRFIAQIGVAIRAAHVQEIIHGNMKPTNILFDESGNAYLSDFTVVRYHDLRDIFDGGKITRVHLAQQPLYASPEQLHGEQLTQQSDIYSLGLLVFHLLSGHSPLIGVEKNFAKYGLPSQLQTARPSLPSQVCVILQKATVFEPTQRFSDVREFVEQLQDALGGNSILSHMPPTMRYDGNPYRGLNAFGEADAELFFGRNELATQLVDHLHENNFLAVIGPSGSGKSSVIKAGLLPALRKGVEDESNRWFISIMTPGTDPMEELEAALLRVAVNPPASLLEPLLRNEEGLVHILERILPSSSNDKVQPATFLLVIDQFEELFTHVEAEMRHLFLDRVLLALQMPQLRFRLVLSLRADFYDRPLQLPELASYFEAHTVVVTPLSGVELEAAITKPADLVGVQFETGLVARIVEDARDQPGTLPLLQYALTEIYRLRKDGLMTHDALTQLGGIAGVIGQRAESIFATLSAEKQSLSRQLFLRLVVLGEGVEDTRRRVLIAELEAIADQDAVRHILQSYSDARLLTFDHEPITRLPTVEVAHEALLREWPRMAEWLDASRAEIHSQRQLARQSAEWQSAEYDPAYFLRDAQLERYQDWPHLATVTLTSDEHAFLEASREAQQQRDMAEIERRERELAQVQLLAQTEHERAEEQTASAGRLRRRAILLASALIAAVLLAFVAIFFSAQANRNAEEADTQRLVAIIAQATSEAESNVRATAEASEILARQNAEKQTRLTRSRELALAAKNQLDNDAELGILLALAALDAEYTPEAEAALHQALLMSNVRLRMVGHGFPMAEIAWSPDGTKIGGASWRSDGDSIAGTAYAWDASTGEELFRLDNIGFANSRIAFSPDSSTVAVAVEDSTSSDLSRFYDASTGEFMRSLAILPSGIKSADTSDAFWVRPGVISAVFSPDGRSLATNQFDLDNLSATVWDIETNEAQFSLEGFAGSTGDALSWQDGPNYSPDGSLLAGGSVGGGATVWDATNGDVVLTVNPVGNSVVVEALVAPDNVTLYVKSSDGVVTAWAIEGSELLWEKDTLSTWYGIDLSRDGTLLASGTVAGDVLILDTLTGDIRQKLSGGDLNGVGDVAFSPDMMSLAGKGENGIVLVWDFVSSGEIGSFPAGGSASTVAHDPSGTIIATAGLSGGEKLWDVLSADTAPPDTINEGRGMIRLWTTATGEMIHELDAHAGWIGDLAFSADGSRLVSSSDDHSAKVWDTTSGELLLTLAGHQGWVNRIAYSPDESQLVTTGQDQTIRFWDSQTGDLLQVIETDSPVWGVAWSPDGKRLATAFDDFDNLQTAIQLWDVATGQPILQLDGLARAAGQVFFTDDGDLILSYHIDGEVMRWDSKTGKLIGSFEIGRRIHGMDLMSGMPIVAIGTLDGTVELWNYATGSQLITLVDSPGHWQKPVFLPGSDHIASASLQEGVVRVFTTDVEALIRIANSRLTRDLTPTECVQFRLEACPVEP